METLYSRKSTSGVKSSTTIQAPSSNHRNFLHQAWHWLPRGAVLPLLPLYRRHCSPCHRDACTRSVGPLTAARWYLFLIVETTREEGIFFFFFRRLFMMDRFHLTHLLPHKSHPATGTLASTPSERRPKIYFFSIQGTTTTSHQCGPVTVSLLFGEESMT